ncbi:hypothetical protein [Paenibacillus gansuensis]|uniref:Uncharacterized protein n=1 Tax=Paenibacillus gansuensis TaxID=306542 RepID=A0ABW5P894_9BACL
MRGNKNVEKSYDSSGPARFAFYKGSYVKVLAPGTYRYFWWSVATVVVLPIGNPFVVEGKDLQLFLHDQELVRELDVVRVEDHEYVLHYEDGQFAELLKPGVYAFWNVLRKHAFVHMDVRKPEVPAEVDRSILSKLGAVVQTYDIASFETGFLYYDHLAAGAFAWEVLFLEGAGFGDG